MHFLSLTRRWPSALWAVVAFVLLGFSLSSDSIDQMESQTWNYARLGTFGEFSRELRRDETSEPQKPLGLFSAWAWARAFGTREAAMRSLNLLWAALALAALARIGNQISIPWLPLLFAIQPFVWYSMNTARTPIMEMAGGSLLLMGTIACLERKPVNSLAGLSLCLGAILLSGASFLGLIPLAAVATGLTAHGLWSRLHWPRPGKIFLLITGGLIAALGIYYVARILRDGGGAQLWRVSPANLCFVCYEFLGLQGLGPGRHVLRSIMKGLSPVRELLPFLPGLLVLLGAYLALFAAAAKSWLTRDPATGLVAAADAKCGRPPASPHPALRDSSVSLSRVWLFGMGVSLQSAFLLFVLSLFTGVPFWGRHLGGAFPFWIVALAIMIRWARQGLWRKAARRAEAVLLGLLLVSSLLVRFAPQQGHDDYRGAAAEAIKLSSAGRTVWWVADYSGGAYYGLPLGAVQKTGQGEILFAMNKNPVGCQLPGAIVISRPDNFDSSGTVTNLLASGMYAKTKTLQAFEVWEKITP